MIACYLAYDIDPRKVVEFEAYARLWLDLVPRFGGVHHGYFLPAEGANDRAHALSSFPSLAAYERYRSESATALTARRPTSSRRPAGASGATTEVGLRPVQRD